MVFSLSGSKSSSSSSSSSVQDVFEANAFQKLFGQASNVAGGIDTSQLTSQANALFQGGQGFLENLESLSSGTDEGSQFLKSAIAGNDDLVNQNIQSLGEDLGAFFNEQLLPGITSSAVGSGQLGGGRQGIAQGAAVDSTAEQFRRGSLDIRNNAFKDRIDASRTLQTSVRDASTAGLAGSQTQFDLANAATLSPFSPFLTLANILGDKTTLTQSESESKSKSGSFGIGAG
jgi:hypothetical protein